MQITLNIEDSLFTKASQNRKPQYPRPIGLAKDRFQVPPAFFDELPEELLNAFEGKDL